MNIPILTTKIYIPQPRANLVRRPRLIERLNEGLNRKLTLISASAGFGKTSLVSEWAAGCGRPVAWLSLDERDHTVTRFLTHFVAALQTMDETIGRSILHALEAESWSSTEPILTMLINEISILPHPFVFVLDDYHVIDPEQIDHVLLFLLEHLPPQMHLVITTRESPQLPLSRLRARGHLTELRASDLRFTSDEAAAFLHQIEGLELSSADMTTLETRTEGWIAGLQLAALSIQGRKDISAFIRAFAGDNRYVVDYLVEEVLERQPQPVRNFLLQTSVLERLCGPLCEAVTGLEDGSERLVFLERGNFFVVPLDDKRQWFRYHHLFADVLFSYLKKEQPDQIAELHLRASMWYELYGPEADAIRHALAADDYARAADLIELAWPSMRRNRQGTAVLEWMRLLPDELFHCRPVLSVEYAWALLAGGNLEAVEDRLRSAEYLIETTTIVPDGQNLPLAGMIFVDEDEFRRLPGSIAAYRSALALMQRDVPAAMKNARQVLDLMPEDELLHRGAATALLGVAAWAKGDLEAGYRMFGEGMNHLQLAGSLSDSIGGTIALATIRIAQSRIREAMRIYKKGLQLAGDADGSVLRVTADIYVGMSEISREYNDLNEAGQYLVTSKEKGNRSGFLKNWYRWHVAMASLLGAKGDLEGALALLEEAERLYVSDFFPNVRPITAIKTRLWITQGRWREALDWAQVQGLTVDDDLAYLREYEHITLARVLIAHYQHERTHNSVLDAMKLLDRLLQAAEDGGRTGAVIEILILQALAFQIQHNSSSALTSLERALTLAEPEGYLRIFVDEGQPIAVILEAALKQEIAPSYVQRLLDAFGKTESAISDLQIPEPLTDRELEVLRLLGTDLSGPDIARKLIVSVNTLRTHTKNIYGKLDVNNRRSAVRRAKDLHLL